MDDQQKAAKIRQLNDDARQDIGSRCKVVMTRGIAELGNPEVMQIARKVQAFDDFTEDNDPHGEHDAGFLYKTAAGEWVTRWTDEERRASLTVMWKFDYYDTSLKFGSEEPWNPAATQRVLTILLSSEY